jgi:hypothetical protein
MVLWPRRLFTGTISGLVIRSCGAAGIFELTICHGLKMNALSLALARHLTNLIPTKCKLTPQEHQPHLIHHAMEHMHRAVIAGRGEEWVGAVVGHRPHSTLVVPQRTIRLGGQLRVVPCHPFVLSTCRQGSDLVQKQQTTISPVFEPSQQRTNDGYSM